MSHEPAAAVLRYAVIGCGAGIAPAHLAAIAALPGASVAGMSDIDRSRGAKRAIETGCPFFVDHRELLRQVRPDVAVICTPHPLHAELAMDCLESGAHVLVEKPIAIDVADADRVVALAKAAGRKLAVNYPERFRPAIEYAREFIASGKLGKLVRVLSIEPQLRNAAYYRRAAWRGTWLGEGGGVLMNQAPHALDLLCHLVGLPERVWGRTTTRFHVIECEDTAQAMFEYAGGAPGYLTVSTVEAGVPRQLQIVGDRSALELVGDRLVIHHFERPLGEHMQMALHASQGPGVRTEAIELPAAGGSGHLAVHRDFFGAVAYGGTPRCDGTAGLMSLELANAIILSSFSGRAVTLPLDRAAYGALLAELRAGKAGASSSRSA
jgi:UDP-N-acetyl-2-amino-2-deoxyglucuronate dehydrogenase